MVLCNEFGVRKVTALSDMEKQIILAMAQNDLNVSYTAKTLNRSRNGLDYHLNKIKKKTGLCPTSFYDLIELLEMAKE